MKQRQTRELLFITCTLLCISGTRSTTVAPRTTAEINGTSSLLSNISTAEANMTSETTPQTPDTPSTVDSKTTQTADSRSTGHLKTTPETDNMSTPDLSYVTTALQTTDSDQSTVNRGVTTKQSTQMILSTQPMTKTVLSTKMSMITALKPKCQTIRPADPVTRIVPGPTVIVKEPGPVMTIVVQKKVYVTKEPVVQHLKSEETSFGKVGLPLFALVLTALVATIVILVLMHLYRKRHSGSHFISPEGRNNNGKMGAPLTGHMNAGFEHVDTIDLEEEKTGKHEQEVLSSFKTQSADDNIQDEETPPWLKVEPSDRPNEDTSLINSHSSRDSSEDNESTGGSSEYKPSDDEEDIPQPYKAPEEIQDVTSEAMPVKTPEEIQDVTSEAMPVKTPDESQDFTSDAMPVKTPDESQDFSSEAMPVKAPEESQDVSSEAMPDKSKEESEI